MKFITVRSLRNSPAKIWKELNEEKELILTNNGKPIALLIPINSENFEETISAYRRAKAINAVKQIQEIAIKKGLNKLSDKEIDDEILAVRKKNK